MVGRQIWVGGGVLWIWEKWGEGVLGGYWGLLTGDLEERVIHYVIVDALKISRSYLNWKCVKNGGMLYGGTWRTLKVPEWRLGAKCHMLGHWWSYFTPKKVTWKCCVHIFIRSVSRVGGPLWGYSEETEGSWLETWRTASSIIALMVPFYPLGRYFESFVFISLLEVCQEWESF